MNQPVYSNPVVLDRIDFPKNPNAQSLREIVISHLQNIKDRIHPDNFHDIMNSLQEHEEDRENYESPTLLNNLLIESGFRQTALPGVYQILDRDLTKETCFRIISEINQRHYTIIEEALDNWIRKPISFNPLSRLQVPDSPVADLFGPVQGPGDVINLLDDLNFRAMPVILIDGDYRTYCLQPHQMKLDGLQWVLETFDETVRHFNSLCLERKLASNQVNAVRMYLTESKESAELFFGKNFLGLLGEIGEAAYQLKALFYVSKKLIDLSRHQTKFLHDFSLENGSYLRDPDYHEINALMEFHPKVEARVAVCRLFYNLFTLVKEQADSDVYNQALLKSALSFKDQLKNLAVKNNSILNPNFLIVLETSRNQSEEPRIIIGLVANFYNIYESMSEDLEVSDDLEEDPFGYNQVRTVKHLDYTLEIAVPLISVDGQQVERIPYSAKLRTEFEDFFKSLLEHRFLTTEYPKLEQEFVRLLESIYPELINCFKSIPNHLNSLFSLNSADNEVEPDILKRVVETLISMHQVFQQNKFSFLDQEWLKLVGKYYEQDNYQMNLYDLGQIVDSFLTVRSIAQSKNFSGLKYLSPKSELFKILDENWDHENLFPLDQIVFLSTLNENGRANLLKLLKSEACFYFDHFDLNMAPVLNSLEVTHSFLTLPKDPENYQNFVVDGINFSESTQYSSEVEWTDLRILLED